MELDRLTEQETQTAMDAIAQIIPVLELQNCLQIVQWATERAAVINQPVLSLATKVTPVKVSEKLSKKLSEQPVVDLSLDEADLEEEFLSPVLELSVVPPRPQGPSRDDFVIPTLELVGEPPEDLPIAI